MGQDINLHQVALVGYGTKFLRGEVSLDAFAQRSVFASMRSAFRDANDPRMLIPDVAQWLGMLRDSGAQRLSLHLLASLPIDKLADSYRRERVVVVHFADQYQVWRSRSEPNAGRVYDCAATVDAALEVPLTNWAALLAAIRKDLDIPTNCPPHQPFYGRWSNQPQATRLPVFPYTSAFYVPHQLMEMLSMHEDRMQNLMISKNENSYYHHLDDEAASKLDHWAARLGCWIVELELRCANEYRLVDVVADDPPLVRLLKPPPLA